MFVMRCFRFLVRWTLKVGILAIGIFGLYGAWDFSQQRAAVGDAYTLSDYRASVFERHADEIAVVVSLANSGRDAVLAVTDRVLQGEFPQTFEMLLPGQAVDPAETDVTSVDVTETAVVLAAAGPVPGVGLAPENSLYPRARGSN